MDRFIGLNNYRIARQVKNLKSNMDRFIDIWQFGVGQDVYLFKIQYG